MRLKTRQLVRETVKAILADPTIGFNAQHAAIAAEENIDRFEIDFAANSKSFLESAIEAEDDAFEFSSLFPAPIAMTLYTVGAIDAKIQGPSRFSGPVEVRIDLYFQPRDRNRPGIDAKESGGTEPLLDTAEEAILLSLHSALEQWGNVVYNQDFKSDRGNLRPVGDGWQQRLSISLVCEVHV